MIVNIKALNINFIKQEDIEKVSFIFPIKSTQINKCINKNTQLQKYGSLILLSNVFPSLKEKDVVYGKFGKPSVNGYSFNISHEGNYVILGSAKNEIGVDLCAICNKNDKISQHFFTEEEHKLVKESETNFSKVWSMKESVIKLLGTGLTTDLSSFSVSNFFINKSINFDEKIIFNKIIQFKDYYISVSGFDPIDEIVIEE